MGLFDDLVSGAGGVIAEASKPLERVAGGAVGTLREAGSGALEVVGQAGNAFGGLAAGLVDRALSPLIGFERNLGAQGQGQIQNSYQQAKRAIQAEAERRKLEIERIRRLRLRSFSSLFSTTPLGLPGNYLDLYSLF